MDTVHPITLQRSKDDVRAFRHAKKITKSVDVVIAPTPANAIACRRREGLLGLDDFEGKNLHRGERRGNSKAELQHVPAHRDFLHSH